MSKICILNLGLYRTGTSMLGKVLKGVGFQIHSEFPDLSKLDLLQILTRPEEAVRSWWEQGGREEVVGLARENNYLCDGWFPLLCFLDESDLLALAEELRKEHDVVLKMVMTCRPQEQIILSELHHWVRHGLERKMEPSLDRSNLDRNLKKRIIKHQRSAKAKSFVTKLKLENVDSWPTQLSDLVKMAEGEIDFSSMLNKISLRNAFQETGKVNANPQLPIEGILLTFRLENTIKVLNLLDQVEQDLLCQYLLVVALDADEYDTAEAAEFLDGLKGRSRLNERVFCIKNATRIPNDPFPICQVWDKMAAKAWEEDASWVVLLGDDIDLHCAFHYRVIYRTFLDIHETTSYPLWFGCPWFNDENFPGFPTFPVVGRVHGSIFGGRLIPAHRQTHFCNQDLDPYLQRLYLTFGAAPPMPEARLTNVQGGSDFSEARYDRVSATGWRDWVLSDVNRIKEYLRSKHHQIYVKIILDVIIPTYRVSMSFLERICALQIPDDMRTTFIVVVDNPGLVLSRDSQVNNGQENASPEQRLALIAGQMEQRLHRPNKNNIRVRCNSENSGASASRNRGLDESSAEYIIFLDDDITPNDDLLEQYAQYIRGWMREMRPTADLAGLVGMVQFPREANMPLKHAAVLMSYLTFMFEVADKDMYKYPAWGVTANLLVKRAAGLRFDTDYAKTGGGEDVDFCLRLTEGGNRLHSAPNAVVHHGFWDGSIVDLSLHFFNWAVGDGALFKRFPDHCYQSAPNFVEWSFLLATTAPSTCLCSLPDFLWLLIYMLGADFFVDIVLYPDDFEHKAQLLNAPDMMAAAKPLWFRLLAHILANLYVISLEMGRLRGHLQRFGFLNITRRFDWHCGRLPTSKGNFRRREWKKFVLFLAITIAFYKGHM